MEKSDHREETKGLQGKVGPTGAQYLSRSDRTAKPYPSSISLLCTVLHMVVYLMTRIKFSRLLHSSNLQKKREMEEGSMRGNFLLARY